ncbi:hypothetical protein, partial [Streptomyces sp. NPDC048650]|uniref:hypothetical protein n=1 Tax=Streptomyces sp. NPDC048650 TaxID=3365583 RepID=UPI00371A9FD1
IFAGAFPPFGFFAFPTLPDPFPSPAPVGAGSAFRLSLSGLSDFTRSEPRRFRSNFGSEFPSEGIVHAFRRVNYFTDFPGRLIIGPPGSNFGNAKRDPSGKLA